MKRFEYEDHPADIYLIGNGKDFKDALKNTALALCNFQVPLKDVKAQSSKRLKIQAEDQKSLIFDFLLQFVILHDVENMVFKSVRITKLQKEGKLWNLEAILKGEEFNPKTHRAGQHIKAITYHNMTIKKTKDYTKIRVLIDI